MTSQSNKDDATTLMYVDLAHHLTKQTETGIDRVKEMSGITFSLRNKLNANQIQIRGKEC
jgi:hypothetical protein